MQNLYHFLKFVESFIKFSEKFSKVQNKKQNCKINLIAFSAVTHFKKRMTFKLFNMLWCKKRTMRLILQFCFLFCTFEDFSLNLIKLSINFKKWINDTNFAYDDKLVSSLNKMKVTYIDSDFILLHLFVQSINHW